MIRLGPPPLLPAVGFKVRPRTIRVPDFRLPNSQVLKAWTSEHSIVSVEPVNLLVQLDEFLQSVDVAMGRGVVILVPGELRWVQEVCYHKLVPCSIVVTVLIINGLLELPDALHDGVLCPPFDQVVQSCNQENSHRMSLVTVINIPS